MTKGEKIFLVIIIFFAFFLRIYQLDKYPPGLYSDETAYGYNAFSLLSTGRDEFGKAWPLSFKSFGDYKPPVSAWLMVPAISVFGLNEFSVRLPSAIAGTLTILIVFFLAKEFFKKNQFLPYIAAILLIISPWHLLFSRSSMLVGIEVMFTSAGLLFFLKGLAKPKFLLFSSICFVGAIYSYYGARITVPLLILSLAIIFRKELWKLKKYVVISVFLAFLLISPLFVAIANDPLSLTGRAKTVSIFYDQGINLKLLEAHSEDGQTFPVLLSRFFHNKAYFYFRDFSRRYFQHFSFDFLFTNGDPHPPFKIPNIGLLYVIDLPFLLYGFYLTTKKYSRQSFALIAYLLVSPVAASFTFITPSANRSFNMIIGLTLFTALGMVGMFKYFKDSFKLSKKLTSAFIVATYLILFCFFLHQYFVTIPTNSAQIWHYGRRELVDKISKIEGNYDEVILSNKEGPAYIWLLFYKKYPPAKYWQSAKINEIPDNLGFIHVESFDKYKFVPDLEWADIEKRSNILYVGFEEKIPDFWTGKIGDKNYRLIIEDQVLYPNGTTAFKIAHLSEI